MNEEEAKTKERMEMEFSNPENFQKVDPQLAEDEEEEAMIEGSSVPMMRSALLPCRTRTSYSVLCQQNERLDCTYVHMCVHFCLNIHPNAANRDGTLMIVW